MDSTRSIDRVLSSRDSAPQEKVVVVGGDFWNFWKIGKSQKGGKQEPLCFPEGRQLLRAEMSSSGGRPRLSRHESGDLRRQIEQLNTFIKRTNSGGSGGVRPGAALASGGRYADALQVLDPEDIGGSSSASVGRGSCADSSERAGSRAGSRAGRDESRRRSSRDQHDRAPPPQAARTPTTTARPGPVPEYGRPGLWRTGLLLQNMVTRESTVAFSWRELQLGVEYVELFSGHTVRRVVPEQLLINGRSLIDCRAACAALIGEAWRRRRARIARTPHTPRAPPAPPSASRSASAGSLLLRAPHSAYAPSGNESAALSTAETAVLLADVACAKSALTFAGRGRCGSSAAGALPRAACCAPLSSHDLDVHGIDSGGSAHSDAPAVPQSAYHGSRRRCSASGTLERVAASAQTRTRAALTRGAGSACASSRAARAMPERAGSISVDPEEMDQLHSRVEQLERIVRAASVHTLPRLAALAPAAAAPAPMLRTGSRGDGALQPHMRAVRTSPELAQAGACGDEPGPAGRGEEVAGANLPTSAVHSSDLPEACCTLLHGRVAHARAESALADGVGQPACWAPPPPHGSSEPQARARAPPLALTHARAATGQGSPRWEATAGREPSPPPPPPPPPPLPPLAPSLAQPCDAPKSPAPSRIARVARLALSALALACLTALSLIHI